MPFSPIQKASLDKIFDPLHKRLKDAVTYFMTTYPHEFRLENKVTFPCYLHASGRIQVHPPIDSPELDMSLFSVTVLKADACLAEGELPEHQHIAVRVEIPLATFIQTPGAFSIYSVMFDTDEEDRSFDQLRRGYIGITKRAPLTRFREHRIKAESGRGSILHHAWSGLARSGIPFHPIFRIFDMRPKTLDQVYAREEELVDQYTLAPKGLNAIPGGMAGIRMMHELRLLTGTGQISVEKRDEALNKYLAAVTSGPLATHFRRGHVRKLDGGGERTTWVRSCWVNLDQQAQAIAA